jgi:hypothetical protein
MRNARGRLKRTRILVVLAAVVAITATPSGRP